MAAMAGVAVEMAAVMVAVVMAGVAVEMEAVMVALVMAVEMAAVMVAVVMAVVMAARGELAVLMEGGLEAEEVAEAQ